MALTNGFERTASFCPIPTAHHPDPLSEDGIGNFFDFESWDGFNYENNGPNSLYSAGPSQPWNLDWFVELDHRHDFAMPSETGNAYDWNIDRSLSQHQTFHQASGKQLYTQTPCLQPALNALAGEQPSGQHTGQAIPRFNQSQDFSGVNTNPEQQFPGLNGCPAWVASATSSSSYGAASSAPCVKHLVPTPPGRLDCSTDIQSHSTKTTDAKSGEPPQPETVSGSLTNIPEMFSRHQGRLPSSPDITVPDTGVESLPAIHVEPMSSLPMPIPFSKRTKKRTRISKATKKILDGHFRTNPYPTDVETSALESATRLTGRTIKTWFSNKRSRTKAVELSVPQDISAATQRMDFNDIAPQNPTQTICRASLDALERLSPAASMTSLERYLAMPFSEEAMSSETLHSFITRDNQEASKLRSLSFCSGLQRHSIDVEPARSVAGSAGSCGSLQSFVSFRSVDSRGCRRGRKAWVRRQQANIPSMTDLRHTNVSPQELSHVGSHLSVRQNSVDSVSVDGLTLCDQMPMVTPDSMETDCDEAAEARHAISPLIESNDNPSTRLETDRRPLFCTWPGCDAKFRFRWEWARHEQAVHYQPYQWICCSEEANDTYFGSCSICGGHHINMNEVTTRHFATCIRKDIADRTFYRKDQLIQHIQGTHQMTSAQGRAFASRWEAPNPSKNPSALRCGFCGDVFATWEERQDHVYLHVQGGVPKSLWTPAPSPET